jgi:nucleoside-diphosphate-sugar epimerase
MQASGKFVDWLAGRRGGVAITGASGWIGRAMAHVALRALGSEQTDRLRLFGARAREIHVAGQTLPLESLTNASPLGEGEWLVLHLAIAGADRVAEPQALRALNEGLLAEAFALASTGDVRRLVSASSGAVYQAGQGGPDKQAYSDWKRDQEQIARAWAAKTGVPLLIPRLFNVGGPYMTHPERYALGDFIGQARASGVIRIGADRPVLRSYVHGLELARVVFDLALADAPTITFDTAGTEVVEMADLARAVGRALGVAVTVERPPIRADGQDRYVGDGTLYQATLAAMGAAPIGLEEIIRDTAASLDQDR